MTTVHWVVLVAAAPVLLVLVAACLRDPLRIALPLYAGLIPFGSGLSVGTSPFSSASSLVGLLLTAGLVLGLVTRSRPASRVSAAVPIWLLFLAVAAASGLWTVDREATVAGLAVLSSLIVVYVLVSVADVDHEVVRRTENALILGAVAAVGTGLYQLAFVGGLVDESGEVVTEGGRLGDGLLGPNIFAVTLLIPFAITVGRVVQPRDPGRRVPHALLAALLLTGILMTGSRTGVLGVGAVVLAMVWVAPRGSRRGLVSVLVGAAAATAYVWVFHPFGLAERTFESTTSSSGRLEIWRVGLTACADYCGAGSGWGTFPEVYAATQASVAQARVLTGTEGSYQAHNLWLLVGVELGVVGFLLLGLGLGLALLQAARLSSVHRLAAVGAVVGLTVGVFFLSSMEFKMFWLVLMLVALYRNAARAAEAEDPEPVSSLP